MAYQITILDCRNELKTCKNMEKNTFHSWSFERDGVPSNGRHSQHSAPRGAHIAILAEGAVF